MQLEDKFSDMGAVHDWSQFDQSDDKQEFRAAASKKLITSFGDIEAKRPEWAERGWTMQELVMSKTTFFVNEEWKPLSRPVESLGVFYHLVPYIEL